MRPMLGLVVFAGLAVVLWLGAFGALAPAAALPPRPEPPTAAAPLAVQPLFLSARLPMGASQVCTLSVSNLDAHLPLTYSVYALPNVHLDGIVSWLALSPTWGRLPPGGRATVEVTFYANEDSLPEAINMATLWVSGDGFSQPLTITLPVLMEVHPLRLQPGALEAQVRPGGQASQPLTLTNVFLPSLDFSLSVAGGSPAAPWLAVSPLSGSLAGNQSRRVTVDLDGTGLSPGLYRGDLLVDNVLTPDWTLTVPVTLAVQPWSVYLPLLTGPGAAGPKDQRRIHEYAYH